MATNSLLIWTTKSTYLGFGRHDRQHERSRVALGRRDFRTRSDSDELRQGVTGELADRRGGRQIDGGPEEFEALELRGG